MDAIKSQFGEIDSIIWGRRQYRILTASDVEDPPILSMSITTTSNSSLNKNDGRIIIDNE